MARRRRRLVMAIVKGDFSTSNSGRSLKENGMKKCMNERLQMRILDVDEMKRRKMLVPWLDIYVYHDGYIMRVQPFR